MLGILDGKRRLALTRQVLLGLLIGIVLACASGVWLYGQHRYGQLLNEWRWRRQVGGIRTAALDPQRGASPPGFDPERVAHPRRAGILQ
ncbi:MAG TPA: hypothetical protein VGX21_21390 [Methylomirabilota bacterium]|nr:hypothetical protein [Methylomirabilota bacterium]